MADAALDNPVTDPHKPKPPLSPQLKIEPASKWADSTMTALNSTDQMNLQFAVTPGPELPGAYPYTPSTGEPGPSFEEVKEIAKEYLHVAGQYVPSQEEIMKMAHSTSEIVGGYFPNGVAAYLGSPVPQQEATISSPIDESETTPTADGCFVIINRGGRAPNNRTPADHDAKHEHGDTPEHASPNENTSTRTQPASPDRRSDANGVTTPFSSITGTAAQNDTKPQAAAARGPLHGDNPRSVNHWPSDGRGHPDGVVNHGEVEVQLGPAGEGTVTGPDSGISAGPGPGPGLTGPTLLQQEKNETTPGGEPMTMKPNGDAIVQSTKKSSSPSKGGPAGSPEHRGGMSTNDAQPNSEGKRAEGVRGAKKGQVGKMREDAPNTKPRTHPLAGEGTQWKGVPLGESHQAALDHDEDRGLRIGENNPNTTSIRTGPTEKPGTSPRLKPVLEQVYSNVATTGHDRGSSAGTAGSSRFVEETQAGTQPNVEPTAQPRAGSPLSDPVNPHVGRAVNGPKAAKLSESEDVPQAPHSRRKSGFMSRFKAWSKRLSQDKKAAGG